MAYFKDGSDYEYSHYAMYPNTVNVGWLAAGESFKKAEPSPALLAALREFCTISMAQKRGLHRCEFCEDHPLFLHLDSGTEFYIGSSEIRVFGDQKIYAAPTLIYHYVQKHHYAPPDDFIDALLHGPQPRSTEYAALLDGIDDNWCDLGKEENMTFKASLFGLKDRLLHDTHVQLETLLNCGLKTYESFYQGGVYYKGAHLGIKLELKNHFSLASGEKVEAEFPEFSLLLYVRGEDVGVDRISQLLPEHGWVPLKSWSLNHDR